MKFLFIFTGGTIGSTVCGNKIAVDSKKPYILIEKYKEKYGIDFDFDTLEPYCVLSENSSGDILKMLTSAVKNELGKGYDGIIVTHGTDTLPYSAAALSYALGSKCTPVCLVSSNRILEDENANGLYNLHGAVCFIKQTGAKGVWVSYKNENDFIKIHRASRLIASNAFADGVYSAADNFYGHFDSEMKFIKNEFYYEKADEISPPSFDSLTEQCEEIMRLEPYVGMTYPEINDKVKYILLGSYHSGTIKTDSPAAAEFFRKAKEKGVKIFITGIYSDISYESTENFNKFGIVPLKNIAPISAYIKLWLSIGQNCTENIMLKSLGGDIWQ